MTVLAAVVDWEKLLQVVWTAAAAGIGVTVIFSTAVLGMARSIEFRGERPGAAAAYTVLGIVGLLASLAVVVWGIVLITSK